MLQIVSFAECGFCMNDYTADMGPHELRAEAVQLACEFLMDTVYPEFNEADVIISHADIAIDWIACTVLVPVRQVYKPEYLH